MGHLANVHDHDDQPHAGNFVLYVLKTLGFDAVMVSTVNILVELESDALLLSQIWKLKNRLFELALLDTKTVTCFCNRTFVF